MGLVSVLPCASLAAYSGHIRREMIRGPVYFSATERKPNFRTLHAMTSGRCIMFVDRILSRFLIRHTVFLRVSRGVPWCEAAALDVVA